jgi:hypothetical protein
MSSSNDHIFGVILATLLAVASAAACAGIGAILVQAGATEAAPARSALAPVSWTPCEAPRPDVECWHTGAGQVIVCLPVPYNEETE